MQSLPEISKYSTLGPQQELTLKSEKESDEERRCLDLVSFHLPVLSRERFLPIGWKTGQRQVSQNSSGLLVESQRGHRLDMIIWIIIILWLIAVCSTYQGTLYGPLLYIPCHLELVADPFSPEVQGANCEGSW